MCMYFLCTFTYQRDVNWTCFASDQSCGDNAEWRACAEPCPRTCHNNHRADKACSKLCQPGCQCQPGFVLADGACIEQTRCPIENSAKKKRRKKQSDGSSSEKTAMSMQQLNLDVFLELSKRLSSNDDDDSSSRDRRQLTNRRRRDRRRGKMTSSNADVSDTVVNTQSSQNTQLRSVESSELLTSDTSSFSEAASRDTKIPQTDDSRQNRRREQRLEQGRRRNDDDDDDAAANFEQLTANDRRLPASERSQRNSAASIKGRRTFDQLERNSYS